VYMYEKQAQAVGELRLSLAVQYIRDASVRRPVQPLPHSLSQRRAERIYGSWVSRNEELQSRKKRSEENGEGGK
jgi:hypothetical protein